MTVRMDPALARWIAHPGAGEAPRSAPGTAEAAVASRTLPVVRPADRDTRWWGAGRRKLAGWGVRVLASALTVVAALVSCLPVLWLAGSGAPEAVDALWRGSWGSDAAAGETLVQAIPLLLAALAIAVAFHGGLFNIGVEGQLTVGGLAAGVTGAQASGLPGPLLCVLCLLAGALAGAAWTVVPALLKAWRGVHEVVTTIMLNYIAVSVSAWAVSPSGPFVSSSQPSATEKIPEGARLPVILEGSRLHAGLLIALAALVLTGWYLYRTPGGFRLRLVGANPRAAAGVGIPVRASLVRVFLLSGALAGLTGAVQVLGLFGRYYDDSSSGYGFDAIAVALLGALSPLGILLAALFFATLSAGSVTLQAVAGINRELVSVVSGVVVALVLAQPWIVRGLHRLGARWRIHRSGRGVSRPPDPSGPPDRPTAPPDPRVGPGPDVAATRSSQR